MVHRHTAHTRLIIYLELPATKTAIYVPRSPDFLSGLIIVYYCQSYWTSDVLLNYSVTHMASAAESQRNGDKVTSVKL